jgi:beta-barrel assembly-enhancing protease
MSPSFLPSVRRTFVMALFTLVAAVLPSACGTPDASRPADQTSTAGSVPVEPTPSVVAPPPVPPPPEVLRELTEPEEIEMGNAIAAALLGASPLVKAQQQQRYINNVGYWIALNSGRPELPWRFGIIESSAINAFATPGGNVFVTRGLIERTRSESELAGILAHQIAHVVQRHYLNDIRIHAPKGLVVDVASLKGGGLTGEAARAIARAGLDVYARGLPRDDVFEADKIGTAIAARSGYEPYGFVAVLQTLNAMPKDDPAMALYLKTRPPTADRLATLEKDLPPWYELFAKPNPALARYTVVFKPGKS